MIQNWAKKMEKPIANLEIGTGMSATMARQLLDGTYNKGLAPKKVFRAAISHYLEMPEDQLFPLKKAV